MKPLAILGATGAIGTALARHLPTLTAAPLRLVSRRPQQVNGGDVLCPADLTNPAQTDLAVAGAEVAFLVAGLPYSAAVWQHDWPRIMTNTLNACEKHGTKLVFFDNVYMYGPVAGFMTEETSFNPASKKGEVRARIARQFLEAVQSGRIQGLIARSADFYGPAVANSVPNRLIFDNLKKGKAAQWPGQLDQPHALTFVPDAARATALLGLTPAAYGDTWHLPTAAPALTARQLTNLAAQQYGATPTLRSLSKLMMRAVGVIVEPVRESVEMFYQNDRPYLFDSSKFERHFFAPTPYAEGIRLTTAG